MPPSPSSRRRTVVALAAAALAIGGVAVTVARRRVIASTEGPAGEADPGSAHADLGWGDLGAPEEIRVPTADGASLATWDVGHGPTVVLPHCWGCSHAIWVPVARRLVASGHRVVLYDQRGHGGSTRGTAPLDLVTLADDLAAVLQAREVTDAVLAGHSMGGMTIMALATHRPEVLGRRARAIVHVATAAADMSLGSARVDLLAARLAGSPLVSRTLRSPNGHHFVRSAFGAHPAAAHMDLTRTLFAACDPEVRAGYLASISTMNLL